MNLLESKVINLPASFVSMTMASGVRAAGERCANKIALAHNEKRITFGELLDRIDRVTNAALIDLGLKPGLNVAIISFNCIEYIELVCGLPEAGLAVATINANLSSPEIEVVCNDAQVHVIFTDVTSEAKVRAANLPMVKKIIVIGAQYEHWLSIDYTSITRPKINECDIWCIPYTSGTTGQPKGVMLSHRSRSLVAYGAAAEFGCFSSDDNFLALTPMWHGGGLGFPMAALLMGGSVEIMNKFDAQTVLHKFMYGGITGVFMVPTHFHLIFSLDEKILNQYRNPSLKTIISNAAPLSQAMKERIIPYFGAGKLFEIYSSTEAGLVCSLRPNDQLKKLSCVGLPHAFTQVKILNISGVECAPEEVGELFSRSPSLFNGYWNRPTDTAEAFRDGWVSVGDLAKFDSEGYIYIVDRKKDMVISGGVNIYPREIEEVLLTHTSVHDVAVIGIPDEKWGESLCAFVVLKDNQSCSLEEIFIHCSGKIADFKIPRKVKYIDMLPRNANGKVLKTKLRVTI